MELDKLSTFGPAYQSKVITCLIYDRNFLLQVNEVLFPDFFDSEANQWLINTIKNYFGEHKNSPSLEVFKCEIEKENNEQLKDSIIKKLRDAYDFRESNDLDYIKKDFLAFCINQNYKVAIYKSVDDLKKGDYDSIKRRFKQAETAGLSSDMGLELLDYSAKEILEEAKRNTIGTPWEIVDEITEGGAGDSKTGELFIVVASPGGGKTWVLASVGAHALKLGKTVFHYTLELSKEMMARRYYCRFTDFNMTDLKFNENEINKTLTNLKENKGRLVVKEYATKRASVNTLTAHIERSIQIGIKPDLIIVDYGDLLKAPRYFKDKRLELGNIYEELRGMSGDFNVPVWTASQSNRSGAETDVIIGEQISEDYSKIMIGDFIMSVSRKELDNESKTARIFIIKNRFGVDKVRFPAKFNVYNGSLSIFDSTSLQGKILNEKMNGDSALKKALDEQYKAINKNKKI
jgi:replicative DNA helicase